jgi:hypothetical protein
VVSWTAEPRACFPDGAHPVQILEKHEGPSVQPWLIWTAVTRVVESIASPSLTRRV